MSYAYTAYDRSGAAKTGVIDASSEAEAREELRRKGLFPTKLTEAGGKGTSAGGGKARAPRARLKSLVFTLRQMSVLVSTGTPVVDALRSIEKQTADAGWRAVLANVRSRVEEGESLSEAMGAHPRCFGPVCQSLVAAGESSGNLSAMLERLGGLIRKQQRMRNAMLGAMVYPLLLISVSLGVLAVMMVVVMPRFSEMFESLDAPLPASTAMLMDISGWLRTDWWVVLLALGGLIAGVIFWMRTAAGRRVLDQALVLGPFVGKLQRSIAAGQIARLLGVLLASRVPLLESVELTRNTLRSRLYRDLLDRASERVTKGEHLSSAFAGSVLIPPSMTEALRSAEKSGSVAPVLGELADFIEEDNEALVRSLTSIIEPMILIVLGGLVAFVAISIFLPLFDLTASAGGM